VNDPIDLALIEQRLDAFLRPEADGPQARRRERILRTASDLFAVLGYRKTSIEDVAGAAGVAKGTIYLYYRTKADLFLHAVALQKRDYLSEIAPAFDPDLAPVEQLRTMIRLGIVLSQRMPLLNPSHEGLQEIEEAYRDADHETVVRIGDQQVELTIGLIDAATDAKLDRDVVENRARVMVDLMSSVVLGPRHATDEMSIEQYAETLADMIVDGLVALP
jgi:AcrR family transcriptional regulator